MKLAYLAILFLTSPAFAGDKIEIPEQPKPVAVANASSNAVSTSNSQSSSNSLANSTSSSNSGGNDLSVGGDHLDAKALAWGAIRAAAAPAVSDTCLIHTLGWDATVGGQTGGTKYDQGCMDRKQCLAIADRLALWGQVDAALEQLRTCDKASFAVPLPRERVPTQSASTAPRESEDCASKPYVKEVVGRALKTCAGK